MACGSEVGTFAVHVGALLIPGVRVPDFPAHGNEPGDVSAWKDADAEVLIEEGRRQLDQQVAQLDGIRGRAQFSFTTALALLLVVLATAKLPGLDGLAEFLLWCIALAMTGLAVLGSASVMVSSSDLGSIDAALVSQMKPPVKSDLAGAYSRTVRIGANSVATRLTVYRDAVWCLLVGAVFYAVTWLTITF